MVKLAMRLVALLLIVVVALPLGTVFIYALAPQILFNQRTLVLARDILTRARAPLTWGDGTIAVTSEGWWTKRLQLHLSDVKFDSAAVNARLATVRGDVVMTFERRQLVVAFGSAAASGGNVHVDQRHFQQTAGPKAQWWRYVRFSLDQRRLDRWRVDGINVTLIGGKRPSVVQLTAVLNRPAADAWHVTANAIGKSPRLNLQLDAAVTADVWPLEKTGVHLATAAVAWQTAAGHGKGTMSGRGPDWQTVEAAIQATQDFKGSKHHVKATATASRKRADVQITLQSPNVAGSGVFVELSPCHVKVSGELIKLTGLALDVTCTAVVNTRRLIKKHLAEVLPATLLLQANVKGSLATKSGVRTLFLRPVVQLKPLSSGFWRASGWVRGNVAVDVTGAPQLASLAIESDVDAGIEEFGDLVAWLKTTAWPMPAPLNQFHGAIDCQLTGALVLRRRTNLPIICTTNLASEGQRLTSRLDVQLALQRTDRGIDVELDAGVRLDDVQVTLPEMKLSQPLPLLTLDKRIAIPAVDHPPSKWGLSRYRVRVLTPRQKLLISTNLLARPVPLGVDLTLSSSAPMTGRLTVQDFSLPLFRRPATVNDFAITWPDDGSPVQVAGHVVLLTPEYNVTFGVIGPMMQPRFLISSQPPLPEQDALAVALFGGVSSSLADDQQRSVEEAAAAVTSEAITLMSMYYLASSPIESIAYNPYSDSLQIKVLLEKNFVLTVGSEHEDAKIGLSRRLGRNWWVETTEVRTIGASERSSQAMLRWGKRY